VQVGGMLAHKRHVCHLYARSLKLARDWSASRSGWYPVAYVIRHQFRENMDKTDPRQIELLVRGTEDVLAYLFHCEPYCSPAAPGGSKYQRNTPVPVDICLNGWTQFDVEDIKEEEATAE